MSCLLFREQLSNYEFVTEVGRSKVYFSYWPAPSSDVFASDFDQNNLLESKLFNDGYDPIHGISRQTWRENILKDYIRMLIANNLGTMDTFLYMFPELNNGKKGAQGRTVSEYFNGMSIQTITDHIFGLTVKSITNVTDKCITVQVGSDKFEGKTLEFFVLPSFGEHTATDVVPILVMDGTKPIFENQRTYATGFYKKQLNTILTFKAKQPIVRFEFSDGSVLEPLSIGLFGPAIAGETLTPDEKKIVAESYKSFTGSVMRVTGIHAKSAERTLMEENGFEFTDGENNVEVFLVGKDDKNHRDPRLFDLEFEGKRYSYNRKSTSYVYIAVRHAKKVNEQFKPQDTEEIGALTLVTIDNICKNFGNGYGCKPAFDSHVRILNEIVIPRIGKCLDQCLGYKYVDHTRPEYLLNRDDAHSNVTIYC